MIDTLVDKKDELKVLNSSFLKISDSCEISIKPPTYEDSQDKKLEFWLPCFKKSPPERDKPNSFKLSPTLVSFYF